MLSEARVGNTTEAKALSDKLETASVANPEIHLERACALAQLASNSDGDAKSTLADEALTALERSVKDGYLDPFRISTDLDLRPLQNEARFEAVLQKLRKQAPK